jgi:hypothetical protein
MQLQGSFVLLLVLQNQFQYSLMRLQGSKVASRIIWYNYQVMKYNITFSDAAAICSFNNK